MVELKRLLAQDAGVSGQIIEESDLTDAAVGERLRSDLRARVFATRLLQRYGYLVPRVNPDSDLEAEQKLVREDRAQMIARAAERRDTLVENSTAGRNAACDARTAPACALPTLLPEDRESLPRAYGASPRAAIVGAGTTGRGCSAEPHDASRWHGRFPGSAPRRDAQFDSGGDDAGGGAR